MTKKELEEIKKLLEQEKAAVEEQLSTFAIKDESPEGDWDTKFPPLDNSAGGELLEDLAKRREEYENLLPVEYALEKKLNNINSALKKIEKGKYGLCEKCGKKIKKERLEALPEARFCMKCQNPTNCE